ncbi:uncharacterized protein EV154DRAFT_570037 [Mucor mucedo]|uniref:uncharacterized protein n=1 Tax=Mucor mucedo TaxID=29922 RepID=UPI00221FEDBB|nr:uncharacterized protein EV154DRAFT_570037 [Mucor mucedo]KAI7873482.1 hypothetical protein EV154DRAFT_570037 [Mucor mucedo]
MRKCGFPLGNIHNDTTLVAKYEVYNVSDREPLECITVDWKRSLDDKQLHDHDSGITIFNPVGKEQEGEDDEDDDLVFVPVELAAQVEAATAQQAEAVAAAPTTTTAASLEAAVPQATDEAAATALLAAAAVEAAAAAAPKTEREAELAEASAELASAFDAVQETTAATSSSTAAAAPQTAAASASTSAAAAAVARVAASPARRPSPVIEKLQSAMARATRSQTSTATVPPAAATSSATESNDQTISAGLLTRLNKYDTPNYLAKLQKRADELNSLAGRVNAGGYFINLIESEDVAGFTHELSEMNDNVSMTKRNYTPADAEDEMVQKETNSTGFYRQKVRGESVLHVYGLLSMAGILAIRVINEGCYTMPEPAFHQELAVIMALSYLGTIHLRINKQIVQIIKL